MPITLTYDLQNISPNDYNHVRSMLERFGWRRLGGSVFRYEGKKQKSTGIIVEDWLNDVVPSLMYMRSYLLKREAVIKFLTIDAQGSTFIDHSNDELLLGFQPKTGTKLRLRPRPTNSQAPVKGIRAFIDAATEAT